MIPALERIDHVHIVVADRAASELWYQRALGFKRVPELEFWATDEGPLTLADPAGCVHIAVFQKQVDKHRSTIAMSSTANDFLAWQTHLTAVLQRPIEAVDHAVSWSLYFSDPDGNPFEITSYDHAAIAAKLGPTSERSP